jgi:hypothetical protein
VRLKTLNARPDGPDTTEPYADQCRCLEIFVHDPLVGKWFSVHESHLSFTVIEDLQSRWIA